VRSTVATIIPAVARILFVGGGARALVLAEDLVGDGHAVRMTTRTAARRAAIVAAGAECWIGTPDRIASLRYALENVTIACWLLGTATGPARQIEALHGSRLDFFCSQTIDTTVRGLLYEAAGCVDAGVLGAGADLLAAKATYNEIPHAILNTDPADLPGWVSTARVAIDGLLVADRPAPGG